MPVKVFNSAILLSIILILFSCEYPAAPPPEIDHTGEIDTIVDIDGNKYKTVGIGTQIWMAQNLKVTKLNDGTEIPEAKVDEEWRTPRTPKFCWYDNDYLNYQRYYGALYNFYSVSSGLLCPVGWHVPGKSEWKTLANYMGGYGKAAGKLKDYNGNFWLGPNNCVENNFGFAALPGGIRHDFNGTFYHLGTDGYWWTASSKDEFRAYIVFMQNESMQLSENEARQGDGYSVRCIKNQ